ncbi:hypothetical protein D3C85_904180 [compost metagenome]
MLVMVNVAASPAQIPPAGADTVGVVGVALTTTFTDLAVAAVFSHLLSPLTVT